MLPSLLIKTVRWGLGRRLLKGTWLWLECDICWGWSEIWGWKDTDTAGESGTWADVSASRAEGTSYTNDSGKKRRVLIDLTVNATGQGEIAIGSSAVVRTLFGNTANAMRGSVYDE